MPIVTAAKRGRQFPRWRDIGIAVQNMADLVRIFLVHTRQRQVREPFCSRNIKSLGGRICLDVFLTRSVLSRKPDHRRDEKDTNQIVKMSQAHCRNNDATIWLGKDCTTDFQSHPLALSSVAQPLDW